MTIKNKNQKHVVLIGVFSFVYLISISTTAFASEISSENIIQIVNQERASYNLSPLKQNSQLQVAAKNKSIDMIVRDYFDHYAFGKTPWTFISSTGYEYQVAGENLALGYESSEGVVNAWMNSPSHRANVLNPKFEEIGVGVVKGEYTENGKTEVKTVTTEMFAQPKPIVTKWFEQVSETITNIFK